MKLTTLPPVADVNNAYVLHSLVLNHGVVFC